MTDGPGLGSASNKKRRLEESFDNSYFNAREDSDEEPLRKNVPSTTHVPDDHDPKLLHYLDGQLIVRHSHFPFASGGFCDVYTGEHPTYGKVAMRRPRLTISGYELSTMTNFLAESEMWKKLRHPNILRFIGVIQSDGYIWAISSFAENGSLPTYLKRHPKTNRRALVLQLADAIRYLHGKRIIHGDIKGSNILVSAAVTVLLSDFGLSKPSGVTTRPSLRGAGSIRWCAPELLFDEAATKTYASDVYSFGMAVYEILNGNVPFPDIGNEVLVINAINDGFRPSKEPAASESGDLYEPLWNIASKSWDGTPSNRPTMTAVCERLGVPVSPPRSIDGEGEFLVESMAPRSPTSTSALVANNAGRRFAQSRVGRIVNHDGYNTIIQQFNTGRYRIVPNPLMSTLHYNVSSMGSDYPNNQMSEDEMLIREMPRAHARYNDTSTKPSRPCHPGTRDPLLRSIRDWIDDDSATNPIFWFCGEVGVGKTTVAHTIAMEQDALKQLAASFFFNRDNDERRHPALFATTIAYQLTRFDTCAHQRVATTLRPDHDIVHRGLAEQFLKLVVQPLVWVGVSSFRKLVIVIDGLDECSDPASLLDVLPLLTEHAVLRLRVLVTSRPHAAIMTKFNGPRLCHLTNETQFRDIDPEILEDDVTAYLEWSLGDIASEYQNSLPSQWPSRRQIESLVRLTGGYFAIASIYDRYLRDPIEGNPAVQLERILSRSKPVADYPTAELDSMYDMVLIDVKRSLSYSAVDLARSLLQLAFLSSPSLSVRKMIEVLDSTPADVQSILRRLTSVIHLSSYDEFDGVDDDDGDDDEFISPFHASFGEYIQDPKRCTVKEFLIQTASSHAEWAIQYMGILLCAAEDRITGLEYDEDEPPTNKLIIASRRLLNHLPLAPNHAHRSLRQAKERFLRDAFWPWVSIWYWSTPNASDERLVKQLKELGFSSACKIDDEASLRLSTVRRVLDHIPHLSVRRCGSTDGTDKTRYEGSRIVNEASLEVFKITLQWKGVLGPYFPNDPRGFAELIRKWGDIEHPNVVPLVGINFESLLQLSEDLELVIYTPSTSHYPALKYHWYPSLLHAIRQNSLAAVESMLEIASALQHLAELAPYQRLPLWNLCLEDIVLSEEGQAMIHPVLFMSRGVAEPFPLGAEGKSLSERGATIWYAPLTVAQGLGNPVWAFGCVLYEMMTGEPPLERYHYLVVGDNLIDDELESGEAPLQAYRDHMKKVEINKMGRLTSPDLVRVCERQYWFPGHVKPQCSPSGDQDSDVTTFQYNIIRRRFQVAVRHLLSDLQVSEDFKGILQGCWEVDPKDQLTMQEIVARLMAIRKAWRNVGPDVPKTVIDHKGCSPRPMDGID